MAMDRPQAPIRLGKFFFVLLSGSAGRLSVIPRPSFLLIISWLKIDQMDGRSRGLREPLATPRLVASVLVLTRRPPLRPRGRRVRGEPPVGVRHGRPSPAVVIEARRRERRHPRRRE